MTKSKLRKRFKKLPDNVDEQTVQWYVFYIYRLVYSFNSELCTNIGKISGRYVREFILELLSCSMFSDRTETGYRCGISI